MDAGLLGSGEMGEVFLGTFPPQQEPKSTKAEKGHGGGFRDGGEAEVIDFKDTSMDAQAAESPSSRAFMERAFAADRQVWGAREKRAAAGASPKPVRPGWTGHR